MALLKRRNISAGRDLTISCAAPQPADGNRGPEGQGTNGGHTADSACWGPEQVWGRRGRNQQLYQRVKTDPQGLPKGNEEAGKPGAAAGVDAPHCQGGLLSAPEPRCQPHRERGWPGTETVTSAPPRPGGGRPGFRPCGISWGHLLTGRRGVKCDPGCDAAQCAGVTREATTLPESVLKEAVTKCRGTGLHFTLTVPSPCARSLASPLIPPHNSPPHTHAHACSRGHSLIHVHMHAHTHSGIHTHTHTHMYSHTCLHVCTCRGIHTCTLTHAYTCAHTQSGIYMHTHMHSHMLTHVHKLTLRHTHAHTHMHSHTRLHTCTHSLTHT